MSSLVYKCTMGFGLLSFQKKGTKKKALHFVHKVLFQQEPQSQPKVPPQHITTLLLIFVFFLLSSIPNQAQLHTQVLADTRH